MGNDPRVAQIRAFNRVVTERLGVLEDRYLARDRSLGLDRVLWEIGTGATEVRELRHRLGLDSGFLSRQLRSLEHEGLVELSVSKDDSRVREAALTPAGLAELAVLDTLSDELVEHLLAPLSERQRDELAEATATVRRLFIAAEVRIAPEDPASPAARTAVESYYRVLDDRFENGFEPKRSLPAADDALRPPSGRLLLATLKGRAVGCVGVTMVHDTRAEIRRLWVSSDVRGLGVGRRLLEGAEQEAASLGAHVVGLETNAALTEAIGLYRTSGYEEVAPFNAEPYAHHWFQKRLVTESDGAPARVGFIGLGIMGLPMARRVAGSGIPLTVWNRTPITDAQLEEAGARTAPTVSAVFAECDTVFVMLRNETAVDHVLRDAPGGLEALVGDRTIVNMGTLSPRYAQQLAADVEAAGGHYVEAPVSGSRGPAENGELVAMVAGRPDRVGRVVPLLEPMCAQITECGQVPAGLTMKLAVNVFLIALVTGLAEAFHFGQRHGLDPSRLRSILDAGQMSSPISRVKTAKLVDADLTPQAAISDVLMNAELIVDAAAAIGAGAPLSALCRALYREAVEAGDGGIDMVGIIRTVAAGDTAP